MWTNASGAIWWPNLSIIASGAIWWPNMQLMQMLPCGQFSHGVNFWVRCTSGNVLLGRQTWCLAVWKFSENESVLKGRGFHCWQIQLTWGPYCRFQTLQSQCMVLHSENTWLFLLFLLSSLFLESKMLMMKVGLSWYTSCDETSVGEKPSDSSQCKVLFWSPQNCRFVGKELGPLPGSSMQICIVKAYLWPLVSIFISSFCYDAPL